MCSAVTIYLYQSSLRVVDVTLSELLKHVWIDECAILILTKRLFLLLYSLFFPYVEAKTYN